MRHHLKIWPQYYCRVEDGSKTFEVRENDRGFQPGDTVVLAEWDPTLKDRGCDALGSLGTAPRGYSGKSLEFLVGYVLPLDQSRVAFSLLTLPHRREPSVTEGDV